MWDADGGPRAKPEGDATDATLGGAVSVDLAVDLVGDQTRVELSPDPAYLSAPDTEYPVTIDPTSVDTGLKTFDPEIASAKILDAPKYPVITFVSTKVKRTGGDKGVVTGNLTFFGVTKPVNLDVVFHGSGPAMGNVQKMGFSATGSFNRSDFGFNFMQGKLSDRVEVSIEAEFNKKN